MKRVSAFLIVGAVCFLHLNFALAQESIDFTIKPPAHECADPDAGVIGLQSNEAASVKKGRVARKLAKWTAKTAEFKKSMIERFKAQETHTVRLNYAFELPEEANDKDIQDISLELPQVFHGRVEYELSCRTGTSGQDVVYRKFSFKKHDVNYEEPPVTVLPHICVGDSGDVVIRVSSAADADDLAKELKNSVFRATLWDTQARMADKAALELYLSKMSYRPGERVSFHAHTLNPDMPGTIEVIRAGKQDAALATLTDVPLKAQTMSAYSYRDGLNWSEAAGISLPSDTKPGYYVAVLQQGDQKAWFPFVVKPTQRDKAAIVIIAATNTWQAYNGWGEGSFYESRINDACLATDYDRIISTRRPMNGPDFLAEPTHYDHGFRSERAVARWLEDKNIPYVVFTDRDINDHPELLEGYDTVMLPSHAEYYTKTMFDAVEKHIKKGGNVLNIGGNVLFYRVGMRGDQVEKHDNGRLGDLESAFLGIRNIHDGISQAKLLGVEYDTRDYDTFAPYRVMHADHPAFSGTGLKNGDLFGDEGSGLEMDVATENTPDNAVILAKGTNPKGYGADMVVFDTPQGGLIFSTGSISFFYGLTHDEKLGTVLQNVIGIERQHSAAP